MLKSLVIFSISNYQAFCLDFFFDLSWENFSNFSVFSLTRFKKNLSKSTSARKSLRHTQMWYLAKKKINWKIVRLPFPYSSVLDANVNVV